MKKLLLLFAVLLTTVGAWAQVTYKPGGRTTTLEAGKKYFIGAATFYNNARYNLLYNNDGNLTYSETKPNALVTDETYLFTVEEVGENNTYYIKNSDGKYLLSDNKTSTETKTAITVVSYASVKGTMTCGNDVQACDENGNKINYDNITNETPIVCVYNGTDANGWRHINGLEFGRPTPFAFYEVDEPYGLPELTTDSSKPVLYTIKNVRGNAYAAYEGAGQTMSLSSAVTDVNQLFYFTKGATDGTYKIHNYASDKKCAAYNSWTADGIDWYIKKSGNANYAGVAISKQADLTETGSEAWNDYQNKHTSVNWYGGNDAGSVWFIKKYTKNVSELGVKMSTANAENLYFIKNQRSAKYANFVAKGSQFTQENNTGYGSYWYFVEKTDAENVPAGYKACYIYNAACALGVENPSNGNMAALGAGSYPTKLYYVRTYEKDNKWGYVMYDPQDNNGWNDANQTHVTNWKYDDAGSIWSLIPANKTAAQLKTEATTAKNDALSYISAAEEADFYTYSDDAIATAKTAVDAIDVTTLDGAVSSLLNTTASTATTTLQATEKGSTGPAVGQYIQLKNRAKNQYMTTMASGNEVHRTSDVADFKALWQVVEGTDGAVKLYNPVKELYLGNITQSAKVLMVEEADAAQFNFANQTDIYGVFNVAGSTGRTYAHMDGWYDRVVGWEAGSEASQWIISEVSVDEALAELRAIYDVVDNAFGDKVGQYKQTMAEVDNAMYTTVKGVVKPMLEPEAVVDVYVAKNTAVTLKSQWDAVKTTVREINVPAQGKFYRLKNAASGNYMCGNASDIKLKKDGASVHTTIFYLGENNTLLSYNSGRYLDCSAKAYSAVGDAKTGEFAMAYGGAQANVITYKNNGYSTYGAGADGGGLDRGSSTPDKAGYNWTLEEVTWLPIPVNVEAGYTTIYSPVELELSQGRFKAYTVSKVSKTFATLTEQTVVPAGVGVVLEYQDGAIIENGCVYLRIKGNETTGVTSELLGTYADEYIAGDAYVLSMVDGEVGFYKAKLNQQENTAFLNNGFKAYLPKPAGSNSRFFVFDFGGNETGIDELEGENGNLKSEIYDLAGRRVQSAQKGVFVVNGKVVIK